MLNAQVRAAYFQQALRRKPLVCFIEGAVHFTRPASDPAGKSGSRDSASRVVLCFSSDSVKLDALFVEHFGAFGMICGLDILN